MAIQEVLVSKIFNYTSEPTKKVEGQFWFNPSTNVLSRYNGTAWKAITVSSDDVAVLSDGNKISLTSYLNTQIAALAEGIDTKQDKLTYYSENIEGFQSNISAPYINLKAAEYVTIGGDSAVDIKAGSSSSSTSHILLSAGDQIINLSSGNDEGTEGNIALNGNISGTGIATSVGSYDMSSTKMIPTEHAVAEALLSKQNKLNFYSETGKDYLSEYTEAKLSNVANITFDATNIDSGSNIKLVSNSAAAVPGYITLQANCTTAETSAKIYLDSGDTNTAASITIDGDLKGTAIATSIPDSAASAVDTKVATQKAIADKLATINTTLNNKQDKLHLYSEDTAEEIAEFNTIYTNINASDAVQLSAQKFISIKANETAKPSSDTSIYLVAGNQSVKINSGNADSAGGILLNGNIAGTGIKTEITNSSQATNYKIPSEKAVATALTNKQDKLSYYKESNNNATIDTNGDITIQSHNDGDINLEYTKITVGGRSISVDANNQNTTDATNILTIGVSDKGIAGVEVTSLSGELITTSINSKDTQLPTSKAVKTELDKKQATLQTYSEVESNTATISTNGTISLNCPGDILLNSTTKISGSLTVNSGFLYLNDSRLYVDGEDWFTMNNSAINAKQSSTDNSLETSAKTIVGAINEINSAIINPATLPTPITDVKTITTSLENLITDTQYANKPGTILINPNIKNTGAILVGEAITDISKAFPIYTDQPVTIAFKNINDFKVAGENTGESFNYIISFGYINQSTSTNA